MINLLDGLCWLVIEGAFPVEDVAAALPWPTARDEDGPRRLALAHTFHENTDEGDNFDTVAIFTHGRFTFVAKPGGLTMTADTSLEVALSARFGVVWCFMSHAWAPTLTRFARGVEVGRVDAFHVTPPEGILGLTRTLGDADARAVIPSALESLVGVPWATLFPREGATAAFWYRTG